MRIRYRKWGEKKWKSTESGSDLLDYICCMFPTETLEVKLDCQHKETFVEDGIRICKNCGEHLKVTSYRD